MRSCHPLVAYPPSSSEADGLSTAQLVSRVADELSRLARDEFELARMQLERKGKSAPFTPGMTHSPHVKGGQFLDGRRFVHN